MAAICKAKGSQVDFLFPTRNGQPLGLRIQCYIKHCFSTQEVAMHQLLARTSVSITELKRSPAPCWSRPAGSRWRCSITTGRRPTCFLPPLTKPCWTGFDDLDLAEIIKSRRDEAAVEINPDDLCLPSRQVPCGNGGAGRFDPRAVQESLLPPARSSPRRCGRPQAACPIATKSSSRPWLSAGV